MTNVDPIVRTLSVMLTALALFGCDGPEVLTTPVTETERTLPEVPAEPNPDEEVAEPEPVLENPVPVWEGGRVVREVEYGSAEAEGYLLLNLGENWTPYLFSERDPQTGERFPNAYRPTYLRLAREDFPENHHGSRARRDKYLELYGILPTVGVLRGRMRAAADRECEYDREAIASFEGFVAYRDNNRARRNARRFRNLETQIAELLESQGVEDVAELTRLGTRDTARVREYRQSVDQVMALRAAQARLRCEGFFGDTPFEGGVMDWPTHEALAEFERRHRVLGWGFFGRETLELLQQEEVEVERRALLRVLTERAVHAAGVIEDGSRSLLQNEQPRTYRGADGEMHPIPNLDAEIRDIVESSFGLETPENARAWLDELGELEPGEPLWVAVRAPTLPEYYSDEMPLEVEIDRGDVWYDFPFNDEGRERAQPVNRRPRLTVFTRYRGQRIPLARFGTTIGGWRSELVDGTVMWKYKMSEIGPRVWSRIVASPVWLPPESTPARELLTRNPRRRQPGERPLMVNYHETGPSYASAYGLVVAYHQRFAEREDGTIRLGGDEGIRTHGSVDYMSIMRRHSHGCHRMHNHSAVRLMSFVLSRRPHHREGQQQLSFRRNLPHDETNYVLAIDEGGYVFRLNEPLHVNVLPGRIRGSRSTPIPHPLPKWNSEVGAYVMPDGQTVRVSRTGEITPYELIPDGGLPDGGDGGIDGGSDAGVSTDSTAPPPPVRTNEELSEVLPM